MDSYQSTHWWRVSEIQQYRQNLHQFLMNNISDSWLRGKQFEYEMSYTKFQNSLALHFKANRVHKSWSISHWWTKDQKLGPIHLKGTWEIDDDGAGYYLTRQLEPCQKNYEAKKTVNELPRPFFVDLIIGRPINFAVHRHTAFRNLFTNPPYRDWMRSSFDSVVLIHSETASDTHVHVSHFHLAILQPPSHPYAHIKRYIVKLALKYQMW